MVNLMVLNLIAADKAFTPAQKTPLVAGSKGQQVEHPASPSPPVARPRPEPPPSS